MNYGNLEIAFNNNDSRTVTLSFDDFDKISDKEFDKAIAMLNDIRYGNKSNFNILKFDLK